MVRGSVTRLLDSLRAGDEDACQQHWERYCSLLVKHTRRNLRVAQRRVADEEDVVISTFDSFYRGMSAGLYPQLNERNNLWNLLVVISHNKAISLLRRELAVKRGGGHVFAKLESLAELAATDPTPEFAAIFAEEFGRRIDGLGEERLQRVALLKIQGHSPREIAEQMGCTVRTIERRPQVIRSQWQPDEPGG